MQDSTIDIEKVYSKAAEAAVLGSMIIDPDCIGKVIGVLPQEQAFFLPENRIIYNALVRLYIDGQKIDAVILRDELQGKGLLTKIADNEPDSVQYIGEIMDSVPSSANALHYAKIIGEKEKARQLVNAIQSIEKIPNSNLSVNEQILRLQETALELEPHKTSAEFIPIGKIVQKTIEGMKSHREIIPTGFRGIDNFISGFEKGDLAIIAGRPSMGKSALMLDMALNIAKRGEGVLIISLEMPETALTERALCNLSRVDLAEAKAQNISQPEWQKVYDEAENLKDTNIILSSGLSTPTQQISLIKRLKKTHNISIVFIDYLQLVSAGKKKESREREIAAISRQLKLTAIKEQIPIVALSQLNRAVESRDKHRPRMSDLRESGSIENDADLVLLIHREDYYRRNDNPDAKPDGSAEIIVAKNRKGRTGRVNLVFLDKHCSFGDIAPSSKESGW